MSEAPVEDMLGCDHEVKKSDNKWTHTPNKEVEELSDVDKPDVSLPTGSRNSIDKGRLKFVDLAIDEVKTTDDGSTIPPAKQLKTKEQPVEDVLDVFLRDHEAKWNKDTSMLTPTLKLDARRKKLSYGDKPVVLLTTGSLNPIHTGHVKNMELAKECLERAKGSKMKVLCGYISPSHNSWLSRKKYGFLHVEHRIEMVKLATADSDWIDCDPHEGTAKKVMDFPEVINRLKSFLHIPVFYVCGADHAEKCYLWNRSNFVVIGRGSTQVPKRKQCYYIENREKNISSTEIRQSMVQGKLRKVKDLLHPKVFDYLEKTKPKLSN